MGSKQLAPAHLESCPRLRPPFRGSLQEHDVDRQHPFLAPRRVTLVLCLVQPCCSMRLFHVEHRPRRHALALEPSGSEGQTVHIRSPACRLAESKSRFEHQSLTREPFARAEGAE